MRTAPSLELHPRTAAGDDSIRIRTILAPVDFSEEAAFALRYATRLAEKVGGRVIALNVVLSPHIYPANPPRDEESLAFEAQHKLDQACQTDAIKPENVETMLRLAAQTVPEEIVLAARDVAADFIVVPATHRAGFRRTLFGDTVDQVVRHAPCPVLMVPIPPRAAGRRGARVSGE